MKNYKNNYYTTTRTDHRCKYCNEFIPKGSEVRTINPKFEGRFWVCSTCDSLIQDIINTVNRRNAVAFDDEGGYMAESDYLSSLYEDLDSRCIDSDLMEQIDNFIEGDK